MTRHEIEKKIKRIEKKEVSKCQEKNVVYTHYHIYTNFSLIINLIHTYNEFHL